MKVLSEEQVLGVLDNLDLAESGLKRLIRMMENPDKKLDEVSVRKAIKKVRIALDDAEEAVKP